MTGTKYYLNHIKAKIQRAHKHILDFENLKKAYIGRTPFTFRYENDKATDKYYIFADEHESVPNEIMLTIGDAIHNLRSALDLLICQLIRFSNLSNDCNQTAFPIPKSNKVSDINDAFKRAKIDLLGTPIEDALKALETYEGGKHHEIWQLHQLDIRDKHRLLLVAAAVLKNSYQRNITSKSYITIGGRGVLDPNRKPEDIVVPEANKPFYIVDRDFMFPDPDRHTQVDVKFLSDIVFKESGIIEGESVTITLKKFIKSVENIVNEFEKFFV